MPGCPSQVDLQRYVEGLVPADQAGSIEQHLAACPRCQTERDHLRADEETAAANVYLAKCRRVMPRTLKPSPTLPRAETSMADRRVMSCTAQQPASCMAGPASPTKRTEGSISRTARMSEAPCKSALGSAALMKMSGPSASDNGSELTPDLPSDGS